MVSDTLQCSGLVYSSKFSCDRTRRSELYTAKFSRLIMSARGVPGFEGGAFPGGGSGAGPVADGAVVD